MHSTTSRTKPSSNISRLVTLLILSWEGRRMGKTPHILVALTKRKVPWWILYHGVHLRLHPFQNKVEACFDCRLTCYRTDVCPKPRKDRCSLCGATYSPCPDGSSPTCIPRCTVCNGNLSTNSSGCEHRYAQRPVRQKNLPPPNRSSSQQPADTNRSSSQQSADAAPTPENAVARGTAPPPNLPLPPAKTTAVFPSLPATTRKAASQPKAAGPLPALRLPHVTAHRQENASLRQELAAQGSLLEAQKVEITCLQAQLRTLEQKL
ncbi:hypothetical protein HPB52_021548 [Rhipicephalus sanguineus]|uniref:Uncharacterized protein n=1 Tax=Rhipicephalus sanguineus TaxID=34632 RepID=A0A9D4PDY1_RHISA|nr:hypothetical protein HPB52_021548 [Rhipicephalus sanguineus]